MGAAAAASCYFPQEHVGLYLFIEQDDGVVGSGVLLLGRETALSMSKGKLLTILLTWTIARKLDVLTNHFHSFTHLFYFPGKLFVFTKPSRMTKHSSLPGQLAALCTSTLIQLRRTRANFPRHHYYFKLTHHHYFPWEEVRLY